jgi:hypothetical protein
MPPRSAVLAAVLTLGLAAPAAADTTTVLEPPDRAPVTIPGSGLQRGERLRGDQVLVRRLTEVRAGTRRTVRLRCPAGTVHRGLGTFERTRIGFRLLDVRAYDRRRALRVEAFAAPRARRGTIVRGSIFALCS